MLIKSEVGKSDLPSSEQLPYFGTSIQYQNTKIVIVGDRSVGKTSLILAYSIGEFPDGVAPTVIDAYKGKTVYKGDEVRLDVYDTAGQEDFARVRPISYNGANVFLVCFSLINTDSLENACTKWFNEVKCLGPKCPFILVGTKSDLRDDYLSSPDLWK